jgi:hypothetical protein
MVGGGDGVAVDGDVDEGLVAVAGDQRGDLAWAGFAGCGISGPDAVTDVDVLDRSGRPVGHEHPGTGDEAVTARQIDIGPPARHPVGQLVRYPLVDPAEPGELLGRTGATSGHRSDQRCGPIADAVVELEGVQPAALGKEALNDVEDRSDIPTGDSLDHGVEQIESAVLELTDRVTSCPIRRACHRHTTTQRITRCPDA